MWSSTYEIGVYISSIIHFITIDNWANLEQNYDERKQHRNNNNFFNNNSVLINNKWSL